MEGDDEDDDRSSASDCPVLLGFLSRAGSSASLLPHRFPSKVGGLPVWLERAHLPDAAALSCGHTGRPLKFLLQVRDRRAPFMPLSDLQTARRCTHQWTVSQRRSTARCMSLFRRRQVLRCGFVYCAALSAPWQGNQVHRPGAVRAFRSQLPRANQFYAFDPVGMRACSASC